MAMNENEEFSKLASIKKCPICGGELEKGYIGAHEGVTWNSNKREYLRVMLWRFYSVFLNIPALRCERCSIIIFDYAHDLRTPRSFMKKCVKCRKEIPIASEECPYCRAKQPQKRE
jgi:hypothetical protein